MILYVSILTVLLCYTMMFYYVIIVVCSRTSCETAFGWWVILGKYVLIKKIKIKTIYIYQHDMSSEFQQVKFFSGSGTSIQP